LVVIRHCSPPPPRLRRGPGHLLHWFRLSVRLYHPSSNRSIGCLGFPCADLMFGASHSQAPLVASTFLPSNHFDMLKLSSYADRRLDTLYGNSSTSRPKQQHLQEKLQSVFAH